MNAYMIMNPILAALAFVPLLTSGADETIISDHQSADWKPAVGPLATRWAKDVSPANALPEYPRPHMVRTEWLNLNGLWDITLGHGPVARILVPYPIESALSGVMKHDDHMTYHRRFAVPQAWSGRHVLLHFGAVDWEAKVSVNGKELGVHRGGYDDFSFDITDALRPDDQQDITLEVFDPTNDGTQPRGKQVLKPDHYDYTSTSGIWQTVWLEPVAEHHIAGLHMVPDIDAGCLKLKVDGHGTVEAVASDEGKDIARVSGPAGCELKLAIPNPKLWSPDSPHLYDLSLTLKSGDTVVDRVASYFGMRKISVGPDEKGVIRILLNNKFTFQIGPLDQGFWPDGIYTAATDEALRFDVAETRRLGFNCTRKHAKVEPERWYYWCDTIGLLVWQDMPAARTKNDVEKSDEDKRQFELELQRMVTGRSLHPSVIMWVLFCEAWGQYDTERLTTMIKDIDPTRLVDSASGWRDKTCGDIIDSHGYPGPGCRTPSGGRAVVIGEFGGLGLNIPGHVWKDPVTGYKDCQSIEDLTRDYEKRVVRAWAFKDTNGCSGAIYTQITDMEAEGNGMLTYDRAVNKVIPERALAVNTGHPALPMVTKDVVPTSRVNGVNWRYSFQQTGADWAKPECNDAAWTEGMGGCGAKGNTKGKDLVRTEWDTDTIWLRKEFDWIGDNADKDTLLMFSLRHSWGKCDMFINGVHAGRSEGGATYDGVAVTANAVKTLKPGKNCSRSYFRRRMSVVLTSACSPKPPRESEHNHRRVFSEHII